MKIEKYNMANNANLHNAKNAKNDEFYTQYNDIAKEIRHYTSHFEGKVVYCNCDDPIESNFTKYFILNFHTLKLKRLICTFYDIHDRQAYAFVYNGEDMNGDGIINGEDIELIRNYRAFRNPLVDDAGYDANNKDYCWANGVYGSGDFRSKNSIEYLKQADIVVTNPPFSLFREYVAQLMEYEKKFIIIGSDNARTYKETFPLLKENKMWIGINHIKDFVQPDKSIKSFGNISWFTNLPHAKRNTPLDLYKEYSNESYPKYNNYDAIEVSKVADIPMDYNGVMGVPITFLDKYCPTQFEIIGCADADIVPQGWRGMTKEFVDLYYAQGNTGSYKEGNRLTCFIYNGKAKVPFKRILIKRK